MHRFKFRLQRLLDVRVAREESLQADLAACLRRYHIERERLDGLLERRRYAILELIGMENAGGKGIQIQECAAYIAALEEQVERQKAILAAAQDALDKKRAELLEACRDRKALERLRKIQEERHRVQAIRDEQSADYELATIRFARARPDLG